MGDFDYGYKAGFWGADGIPYWINSPDNDDSSSSPRRRSSSSASNKRKHSTSGSYGSRKLQKYNASEQLAYNSGFRAVYEGSAYNGRYFEKDGKKWIHSLSALKHELGVSYDWELEELGYDVDAYHEHH